MFQRFLAAAILCAAVSHAASDPFTFTGALSPDWSDPGNWSPGGVPGVGDTAILAGTSVATLSGAGGLGSPYALHD